MEKVFINNNGVKIMFKLMQSINGELIRAALGSLSNLVGNSNELRKIFLELNI